MDLILQRTFPDDMGSLFRLISTVLNRLPDDRSFFEILFSQKLLPRSLPILNYFLHDFTLETNRWDTENATRNVFIDMHRLYCDKRYCEHYIGLELEKAYVNQATAANAQMTFTLKKDRLLNYLTALTDVSSRLEDEKVVFSTEDYLGLSKILLRYLPNLLLDRHDCIVFISKLSQLGMFSPQMYRTKEGGIVLPFPVTEETLELQKGLWKMFMVAIGGKDDGQMATNDDVSYSSNDRMRINLAHLKRFLFIPFETLNTLILDLNDGWRPERFSELPSSSVEHFFDRWKSSVASLSNSIA
jgi:hypothetical protein